MNNLFYLDDLEIEEPMGFDGIELSIKRDETYHGMTFEAATSPLQFYGVAATYLKEKHDTDGVKANVNFRALSTCGQYDYEELLSGRLNFGKYKESCGNQCLVSIPWEQESCETILKSRFDQQVDIDKSTAVDGITGLSQYAGLAVDTELPAKELQSAIEGYEADEGDEIDLAVFPRNNTQDFAIRPTYSNQVSANISEAGLIPTVFAASQNGLSDPILSPQLLLAEEIDCFPGDFEYTVRLKGSYDFLYQGINNQFHLRVARGEWPGSLTILNEQVLPVAGPGSPFIGTFDYTFTGSQALNQGEGFYAWIGWVGTEVAPTDSLDGSVTFDKETYIRISALRSCPATTAGLYMIHETLSRTAESITNGCVRVKSSYYGRTDSEPFSFPADGCGGLRSVTSGLKIRKAPEDKFFTSLKAMVDGLNAIDNIGMAVETDPNIPSKELLVIEDVAHFYQDKELLRHDYIPKASIDIEEMKHYSKILVGYKKWEVEEVNGLDEFNSNRQYNTSIDTVDSTLDITSSLVAGSYAIELTRQQSFAATGAADTKYDNETFIICMHRSDYPVYDGMYVEQGNITNPQNIFSPSTIYNYRISPIRNLMRWYKSIAAAFKNIYDSANKLFFSAGTGNLIASGIMTDPVCRMERVEMAENSNVFVTQFTNTIDFTPLWENETLSYDYPMSLADYKIIKQDPYGYISSQCGDGDFKQYWIKEIKYRMMKGTATFILKKRYGI